MRNAFAIVFLAASVALCAYAGRWCARDFIEHMPGSDMAQADRSF